jgi:hypothetical protein
VRRGSDRPPAVIRVPFSDTLPSFFGHGTGVRC